MSSELRPRSASSFLTNEPVLGGTWPPDVLELAGLDVLRASVERRLPDPPISHLSGLRLSEVGLGMATSHMPATEWWQSGAGVFFAGTTAFVADLALGAAVLTSAPAGVGMTTSELSVNYLRIPTLSGRAIIGRGRLIHGTRSLGLAEATIEDAYGRLLGHASSRCVLFPVDPEILAARALPDPPRPDAPDPYLREVEGDVRGPEFWDTTPGLEVMQQFMSGTMLPPSFHLMGLRGVEAHEGRMTVAMPASQWFCNAFGVVYGGAIAFLADTTITMTAASTVPAATAFNTIDLKLYFLRPAVPSDGELVARATVVHRGRTVVVVDCDIGGPDGATVARATGSVLVLPGRKWERPVSVADELTDEPGRVLTTILFVDMVDSTGKAVELGDRRWRKLLSDYHAAVREQVRRFRGREIDTAGDGFFVAFDAPARAVRCAAAIRAGLRQLDLSIRAGIHAGECEESGGKLVGIAVHIGARIAAAAADGEILASSTVKDLTTGSTIEFGARGEHELKGISQPWHLYAVLDS